MIIAKLNNKTLIIIIIQSIGMFIGTTTHLRWIIQNGLLSENYKAPFLSMLFWDSLVLLDTLAAILLIFQPKAGLWLTAMIISVDVLHNGILCFKDSWINLYTITSWMENNRMLITQFIFGLFVLISFKSNMKEINLKLCY